MYLRSISFRDFSGEFVNEFPFNVPSIKSFENIEFAKGVTFFVGENGSGKSTLLEALAAFVDLPVIGRENIESDTTLKHAEKLADYIRPVWNMRTRKGFFLRSEDFFNFSLRLENTKSDLDEMAKHYEDTLSGYGLQLAKGATLGQKNSIINKYGDNLDSNSHGESFMKLFETRVKPGGLYLLDEPETPLSPLRQLNFISFLKKMVKENCQFIIVTHSPMIMAFPESKIYSFDELPVQKIKYDEVEHVKITRDFLNDPENFIRFL